MTAAPSATTVPEPDSPTAGTPAPMARRIAAQGRYEVSAMLRNGEQLMLLILFPLMALFGLVRTGFLDTWAAHFGVGRVDVAMPGVLALCAMSTALSGQGIATGFDRRYGVLRFLSTTPLGRSGLMAGKAVAVAVVVAIQYVVMGATGLALGWHPHLAGLVMSVPTLLLGAAAFTALGMLVAGTVRAEGTLAVVNTLWAVLATVGGSLIPPRHFPGTGSWLVELLPSGALGEALRAQMLEGRAGLASLVVLLAWTLLAGALAKKYFKWT